MSGLLILMLSLATLSLVVLPLRRGGSYSNRMALDEIDRCLRATFCLYCGSRRARRRATHCGQCGAAYESAEGGL